MPLYKFRLEILEKLLPAVHLPLQEQLARPQHLPSKINTSNEQGKTLRKKCRNCSKKKIRKDTIYHCLRCSEKPGLCLGRCFQEYHKNLL